MLGLGSSLVRGGFSLLTYIKDGLKLYMPYKKGDGALQFVGTGSTSFDGTNDEINLDDGMYNIGSVHTVSAWVKLPAVANNNGIVLGGNANYYYMLNITASGGTINNIYYGGDGTTQVNVSYTDDQQWHYYSIVRNDTSVKFYVDAVQQGATQTLGANDDAQYDRIGRGSAAQFLKGDAKNVAVWNRALTATEVQNVMYKSYHEVSGRLASGLVSWWSLETSSTDNPAG